MSTSGTRKAPRTTPRPAQRPAAKAVALPERQAEQPVADYDLATVVDQRRDALGHDGDMVTFTHAGEVFSFPHPLFATDEWKDGLAAVGSDVEFGEYLLGEEQYDLFHELGGRSSHLAILLQQVQADAREVDAQRGPTQFSTSSRAQRRRQRRA
jgi:hypothetical protein